MAAPAEKRPATDHTDAPSAHANRDETVAAPTGPPAAAGVFGPPPHAGEVGTLGPYRIVKELGKGGMGAVYAAIDTRLERPLALKVMLPEFAADANAKERFLREARLAARVKHDHVVTVYEADERDGVPYIAMEFLEGLPLDAYLKKKGDPTVAQAVRIATETALGLAAAHKLGLVHRDVKPANLWLEAPNGRVKVLDFGLARPVDAEFELTKSGAVMGTPAYMSLEQARGEKVDHRTDLFSLGAVLYRLTTGRLPFQGATTMAVLIALGSEEPPPVRGLNPDVPEPLAQLIHQLLSKRADDRPASAAEVVERLRAIAEGRSPESSAPRPRVVYVPTPVTAAATNPFADIDAPDPEETALDSAADSAPLVRPAAPTPGARWVWPAVGFAALLAVVVGVAIFAAKSKTNSAAKVEPPAVPTPVLTPAPKPAESVPIDPDRRAAEWVIKQGGFVCINNDDERQIDRATALPREGFALTIVGLHDTRAADAGLVNLRGLKNLTYLVLWKTGVSDAALEHLADLPALRILDLYGTKVTGAGLKHLKNCPNLTHIDLGATLIDDAGLEHLKELTALVQLDLNGTAVSDAGLKHLKELRWLKHLALAGTKVTATGRAEIAAALPGCTLAPLDPDREAAFYALSLGGKVRINGAERELASAAELPKHPPFALTEVNLSRTKATDAGLVYLKNLKALTGLDLSGAPVSDAGLEHIKELTSLKFLGLHNTKVTDEGLASLKELTSLQSLNLNETKVAGEGLGHLKNLNRLQELYLNETKVTDAGVAHLNELRSLVQLGLVNTPISDAGLEHLKGFKNLGRLKLNYTKVTDAGLIHLQELKNLKYLEVQNTKVAAKGAESLAAALPGCKIDYDGGVLGPKK